MSFSDWSNKKAEEEKKKKKKEEQSFSDWSNEKYPVEEEDIAPVRTDVVKENEGGRTWFESSSLWDDGYDFGDVTRTAVGSVGDLFQDAIAGILGIGEQLTDASAMIGMGAAKGFRSILPSSIANSKAVNYNMVKLASETKDFVAKDLYDEEEVAKAILRYDAEDESVFGAKSDSLAQSGGKLVAQLGANAIAPVSGLALMGVTAFGSETENALRNDATLEEAAFSGLISAGAEMLTEQISGGIKFGGKTLDDALTKRIASTISDKTVRTLAKAGMDMAGEGLEEVLSGHLSAIGQKLTYMDDKELNELFSSEDALESFIGGAVLGGFGDATNNIIANKKGVDAVTGNTKNEQAVIDKVLEDRIADAEKDGKKLSGKEKTEIYDKVVREMERGYISTDTIEEVLGGDSYKAYKDSLDSENALKEELEALQEEYKPLYEMKGSDKSDAQIDRQAELKNRIGEIKAKLDSKDTKVQRDQLKTKLGEDVSKLVQNDRLVESYNEGKRRKQAFQADLTKYDTKQQETIKKAVESGILNNSNRTHEFVDMVAKISADKGVPFDFANNQKLKESGFAIDGKMVNGFKNKDGITINVQSAKSLNSIVGHEITHVLEGTDLYNELQTAIVEYAKSKNDYQGRYDSLAKLYENIEGANIDSELTADLVGDYLFTDADFINNLSTKHRNVFEKIYDEVKYLCKIATAGSKEARALEKVKKAFEDAYRFKETNLNEATDAEIDDVQYSVSVTDKATLDSLNDQVAKGEYDAEKNQDGGYYVTYKSMSFWGYDADGNAILRSPMAEYVDGELSNAYLIPKDKSKLNWYQSTETIDENTGLPSGLLVKVKKPGNKSFSYLPASENQQLIADDWSNLYFNLKKKVYKNGKWVDSDVPARYNPYEHSSNSMLNDQFSTAYLRDNLVTVKMYVPVSEDNGAFRAKWSKDPTGWADWKTGTVAGKINKQKDLQRRVFLSRYAAPVEIVSDSEVAQAYKEYLDGTDVTIPDNVVSPNLLNELKLAGVPITESGKVKYSISETTDGRFAAVVDNDILSNIDTSSWDDAKKAEAKKAASDALKQFSGGIVVDGITRKVNRVSRKEYTRSNYTESLYNNAPDVFADKMRVADVADDIVIVATDWKSDGELKHPRNDNFVDFDHGKTLIVSGDAKYTAEVVVGITDTGEAVLYDVVDMTPTEFDIKKEESPTTATTQNAIGDIQGDSSADNVAQKGSNVNGQFSLSDSDGRQLSNEQQEYFKDSKAVDENGNLKVVYHGTRNADFTVFKQTATYFTDNKEMADSYSPNGDMYEGYVNITKPYEIDAKGEKWSKIPIDGATKKFLQEYGSSVFKEDGKWRTSPADIVSAIEEAVDNGDMDYDGIIIRNIDDTGSYYKDKDSHLATDYIVFNSNQFKNADNKAPTSDPDINFSMSEQGEEFAPIGNYNVYGKDVALDDIAPVAETAVPSKATVDNVVDTVEDAPVAETVDAESVMVDRDSFVSQQAMELYKEITGLKKGVRASKRLGYLLDHGHEWRSIKTALLNIRDNPNQVVNPNSAAETVAREMLGREYDEMVYELSEQSDVAGSIRTKMQHIQTEIANNERLREQSNADYDSEIAEVQAEYDAKKNKNTIVANNLLRRIERLNRMKNTNDANFAKRISDLEARIEKMSKPTYKTAVQRKAKQTEYTNLMENLVGDTSTWVDKKLGISYKVNTLRRNLRDVVRDADGKRDIPKADAITDELQGNYNHNEADLKRESRRMKSPFAELNPTHAEEVYAHMLGEFRHNPDTKLSEETVKEFYEKHKSKIDTKKVDKYIEEAMKTFDDLFVRINERLKEQGMKEIPYRKGYFPHFTNPKQGVLAKLFNWKTVDTEIPTSIAGLTETFDPERSWQGFSKQRKGDTTDYNLAQALDTYIHGALDWIYHIEDIQKSRALENYIRYTHSEEGVKARIDAINNSEELDADEAQRQIDAVYAEANNPLNNLVTNLRARTNTLANKKSENDRQMESDTNRKIYSVMTNLNNRINANMVVGSFSSALTNFIPITQSWMEVSPVYSLRGMKDTIKSTIRDDGMVNKSDFLTNRLLNEENLYQTFWDKASEKAAFMMEAIDNFASQTVWRSKYLQNISEGMGETEAIKNADQFAENVIAGRSRGNMPTIFDAKNPITKMFTAFQLEVSNQYGYMFKDAPQDSKNKARLIKGYATAFLGAYAYNALYSSLVGRDAAFDPIGILEDLFRDMGLFGDDEEEEPEGILLNFGENILQEVPFVGGLMGGGRVPMSSALPYSGEYGGLDALLTDVSEGNAESIAKEMLKPLYYLVLPFGGGQIKKTNEGLGMFSDEHPIAGSYTESGNLRFPVEDNFWNRTQATLFGQYASENARDYFDNGRSPLKEKQIQEFIDLDIPIRDYWEYREGLSDIAPLPGKSSVTLNQKGDYIGGLDLPVSKKNILINNIASDRNTPIDMTGYDNYKNFEEFDFAQRYPEKYAVLMEQGVSVEEYKKNFEETVFLHTDDYSWAADNPGKYAISKVISGDVLEYKQYASELSGIEADKDENGKSISGSKKEKVINYIESLPLDYGQKIILYKSMYDSKEDRNNYNADIVEYLDSRDDISYEDMVTILTELGMTVSGNNVYWD